MWLVKRIADVYWCVLQWYEHAHNKAMGLKSIARMIQTMLYGKRFFPYYVYNILGGIEEDGEWLPSIVAKAHLTFCKDLELSTHLTLLALMSEKLVVLRVPLNHSSNPSLTTKFISRTNNPNLELLPSSPVIFPSPPFFLLSSTPSLPRLKDILKSVMAWRSMLLWPREGQQTICLGKVTWCPAWRLRSCLLLEKVVVRERFWWGCPWRGIRCCTLQTIRMNDIVRIPKGRW